MNKILFFDTGPIITLVLSRLSWLLPALKKQFGGKFYITPAVKLELVDRPLQVRRFSLEALQVSRLIREGILEIYDAVPEKKVHSLQQLANQSFMINGKTLDIIQTGEMEAVVCAMQLKASVVMDERTLRLFMENSNELAQVLERRFGNTVTLNKETIKNFNREFEDLIIIRSIELVSVAYKLGLLDSFRPEMKNGKEVLIESLLWATKYNGCAVTDHEIEEIKKFLVK